MKRLFNLLLPFIFLAGTVNGLFGQSRLSIIRDKNPGAPVLHGLAELTNVLKTKKISYEQVSSIQEAKGDWILVVGLSKGTGAAAQLLKAAGRSVPETMEALSIWKMQRGKKDVLVINGYDDRGVMYGLLDVADRIGWNPDTSRPFRGINDITEKPAIAERAVSLYTMNRAYWESRLYDEAHWIRYFDLLTRSRFNMFTIIFGYENGGFLAPCYPYFFTVDGYTNVTMNGLTAQQQQRNLAAMNRIIQLAHDRGINITLGIWDHIYWGGIQAGDMDGGTGALQPKSVIVTGLTSDNLIPYTAAALNKLITVMPGLDAIQFRMHGESGLKQGEQRPFWKDLFQSIKKTHPTMRLVLRAKDLPDETIQDAIDSGVNFSIGTKFWMEQTGLPFSPTHVYKQDQKNRRHGYADMLRYPQQYPMTWRLWTGGTNRILTWGDPDYTSRFIRSLDIYGDGSYAFEVNEMLATKMEAQSHDEKPFELLSPTYKYYDYEFERYWDFYLSYGRMGYNPATSTDLWTNTYNQHFGEKAGPVLEKAVHMAAKILPRIVASTYNYSFFPTTRGWAEKQRIGDLDVYARAQGSDVQQFVNFDEEAQLLLTGGETAKILPSTNSVWLRQVADSVSRLTQQAQNVVDEKGSKEFKATVVDLTILSNLALYHSRRIPAAVYYCLYKRTKDIAALDSAIAHERNAIAAWKAIVDAAGDMYAPDLKFGPAHTGFEGVKFEQAGHWNDELKLLNEFLVKLQTERQTAQSSQSAHKAPVYKPATDASHARYFSVRHAPVLTAPAGKPVTITVHVSAPAGVKWVRLQHRSVNQYLDFSMLPMTPTSENDTYQATIPADQIDSRWNLMYLIELMDNNGKGFIYPDLNQETPYIVTKLNW